MRRPSFFSTSYVDEISSIAAFVLVENRKKSSSSVVIKTIKSLKHNQKCHQSSIQLKLNLVSDGKFVDSSNYAAKFFYAKTNYHTMGGVVMLPFYECIKIIFRFFFLFAFSIPPLCWRRSRSHFIIGPKNRSIGFGKFYFAVFLSD